MAIFYFILYVIASIGLISSIVFLDWKIVYKHNKINIGNIFQLPILSISLITSAVLGGIINMYDIKNLYQIIIFIITFISSGYITLLMLKNSFNLKSKKNLTLDDFTSLFAIVLFYEKDKDIYKVKAETRFGELVFDAKETNGELIKSYTKVRILDKIGELLIINKFPIK